MNEKAQHHNCRRFGPAIRIISTVLVVAFVAQDIAWAYPDKLAAPSFFKDKESLLKTSAKIIETVIENNPSVSRTSLVLAGVIKALENYRAKDARWFDDNIAYNVRDNGSEIAEVLISVSPGYILRYFDPAKSPQPPEDAIALNARLSKQLIKPPALPQSAMDNKTVPEEWKRLRDKLAHSFEPLSIVFSILMRRRMRKGSGEAARRLQEINLKLRQITYRMDEIENGLAGMSEKSAYDAEALVRQGRELARLLDIAIYGIWLSVFGADYPSKEKPDIELSVEEADIKECVTSSVSLVFELRKFINNLSVEPQQPGRTTAEWSPFDDMSRITSGGHRLLSPKEEMDRAKRQAFVERLMKRLGRGVRSRKEISRRIATINRLAELPPEYKTAAVTKTVVRVLNYKGPGRRAVRFAVKRFFESIPDSLVFMPIEKKTGRPEKKKAGVLEPMEQYLKEISVYPLLTPLGAIKMAALLKVGDEWQREEATRTLLESNQRLLVYIGRKFFTESNMTLTELISAGSLGLQAGIGRWDPGRGIELSTYLSRCIINAINDERRKPQISTVSLESSGKTKGRHRDDADEASLLRQIEQYDAGSAEFERREALAKVLAKTRAILDKRWGSSVRKRNWTIFRERVVLPLEGEERPTLAKLGGRYKIGRERVRQIEEQALREFGEEARKLGFSAAELLRPVKPRRLIDVSGLHGGAMIPAVSWLLGEFGVSLKLQAFIEQGLFWAANLGLYGLTGLSFFWASAITWSVFVLAHFFRTKDMPQAPPPVSILTVGLLNFSAFAITNPILAISLLVLSCLPGFFAITTYIHHRLNLKYIEYQEEEALFNEGVKEIKELIIKGEHDKAIEEIILMFMPSSRGVIHGIWKDLIGGKLEHMPDDPLITRDSLFEMFMDYGVWSIDPEEFADYSATVYKLYKSAVKNNLAGGIKYQSLKETLTLYFLYNMALLLKDNPHPDESVLDEIYSRIIKPFRFSRGEVSMLGAALPARLWRFENLKRLPQAIRLCVKSYFDSFKGSMWKSIAIPIMPAAIAYAFIAFTMKTMAQDRANRSFVFLNKTLFTEVYWDYLVRNNVIDSAVLEDIAGALGDGDFFAGMSEPSKFMALLEYIDLHTYGYPMPAVIDESELPEDRIHIAVYSDIMDDNVAFLEEAGRHPEANVILVLDERWIEFKKAGSKPLPFVKQGFVFHDGRPAFVRFSKPRPVYYLADFLGHAVDFKNRLNRLITKFKIPTVANNLIKDYTLKKDISYQVFAESGVPIPHTLSFIASTTMLEAFKRRRANAGDIYVFKKEDFSEPDGLSQMSGWPLRARRLLHEFLKSYNIAEFIVKPNSGSGGEGVEFFTRDRRNESANRKIANMLRLGKGVVIQARKKPPLLNRVRDGVSEELDWNIRVFVSKDGYGRPVVSDMVVRVDRSGGPVNISKTAGVMTYEELIDELGLDEAKAAELKHRIEAVSLGAFQAIEDAMVRDGVLRPGETSTDFMGVDIIVERSGNGELFPYILEVNDYCAGSMWDMDNHLRTLARGENPPAWLTPDRIGRSSRDWVNTMIRRARKFRDGPKAIGGGMIPAISWLIKKYGEKHGISLKLQAFIEQGLFWSANLGLYGLAGLSFFWASAITWSAFVLAHFFRTKDMPQAPPLSIFTIAAINFLQVTVVMPGSLNLASLIIQFSISVLVHHVWNIAALDEENGLSCFALEEDGLPYIMFTKGIELPRPEAIDYVLGRFVEPDTRYGRQVIRGLEKLHVAKRELYYMRLRNKFLRRSMVGLAAAALTFNFFILNPPIKWAFLAALMVCGPAFLFAICLDEVLSCHFHMNDTMYSYAKETDDGHQWILLSESFDNSTIAHEFGHTIMHFLNIRDEAWAFGATLEYLAYERLRTNIPRHEIEKDIKGFAISDARSKLALYLAGQKKVHRTKKVWHIAISEAGFRDNYSAGSYIGVAARMLFPDDDKKAFEFALSVFKEAAHIKEETLHAKLIGKAEALIGDLRSSNYSARENARRRLSRMRDPVCADVLISALRREEDEDVKKMLIQALAGMRKAAIGPILDGLYGKSNIGIQDVLVDTLGEIGAASPEVLDALKVSLSSEYPSVRVSSSKAFVRLGTASVETLVEAAAKARDYHAKEAAIEALGEIGDARCGVIKKLVSALDDPTVNSAAAEALGKLGPPAFVAIPALRKKLNSEYRILRASSALALAEIGDEGSLPAFKELLTDADDYVRKSARDAIAKIEAPQPKENMHRRMATIKRLMLALADEDAKVRKRTIEKLFRLRAREAADGVAELLGDASLEVREAAFAFLESLNWQATARHTQDQWIYHRVLRRNWDSARSLNPHSARLIAKDLEREDADLRAFAIEALAAIGDESSISHLEKITGNEKPSAEAAIGMIIERLQAKGDGFIESKYGAAPEELKVIRQEQRERLTPADIRDFDKVIEYIEAKISEFEMKIPQAKNDWERKYFPKYLAAAKEALERIKRLYQEKRIFTFPAIVYKKEDYALGYGTNGELGIAKELADIELPLLAEYVFHEALCFRASHWEARNAQERIFTDNYIIRPGGGNVSRLKVMLRGFIDKMARTIDGVDLEESVRKALGKIQDVTTVFTDESEYHRGPSYMDSNLESRISDISASDKPHVFYGQFSGIKCLASFIYSVLEGRYSSKTVKSAKPFKVLLSKEDGLVGVYGTPPELNDAIKRIMQEDGLEPVLAELASFSVFMTLYGSGYLKNDAALKGFILGSILCPYEDFCGIIDALRLRKRKHDEYEAKREDDKSPAERIAEHMMHEELTLAADDIHRFFKMLPPEVLKGYVKKYLLYTETDPDNLRVLLRRIFKNKLRSGEAGEEALRLLWDIYLDEQNSGDENAQLRDILVNELNENSFEAGDNLAIYVYPILKEGDINRTYKAIDIVLRLEIRNDDSDCLFELMKIAKYKKEVLASFAIFNAMLFGIKEMPLGGEVSNRIGNSLTGESRSIYYYLLKANEALRKAGGRRAAVDGMIRHYTMVLDNNAGMAGRLGWTWFSHLRQRLHGEASSDDLKAVRTALYFWKELDESIIGDSKDGLVRSIKDEIGALQNRVYSDLINKMLKRLYSAGRIKSLKKDRFLDDMLMIPKDDVIDALKKASPDCAEEDVRKMEYMIELYYALNERYGVVAANIVPTIKSIGNKNYYDRRSGEDPVHFMREDYDRLISVIDGEDHHAIFSAIAACRTDIRHYLLFGKTGDVNESDEGREKSELLELDFNMFLLGKEMMVRVFGDMNRCENPEDLKRYIPDLVSMGRFMLASGLGGVDFEQFIDELERGNLKYSQLHDLTRALRTELHKMTRRLNENMRFAMEHIWARPNLYEHLTDTWKARITFKDEKIDEEGKRELENGVIDDLIRDSGMLTFDEALTIFNGILESRLTPSNDEAISAVRESQEVDIEAQFFRFGQPDIEVRDRLLSLWSKKGLNLVKMSEEGLSVPPGVILSARLITRPEVFKSQAFQDKVLQEIGLIRKYSKYPDLKLLLYARSGSAFMLPGLLATVSNLGMNDREAEDLARTSGDEWFAYNTYAEFIRSYAVNVLGIPEGRFEEVLDARKKDSLTGAEMKAICEQYKTLVNRYGNGQAIPEDMIDQVMKAIEAVYASWDSPEAREYRARHKISQEWGTVVILQKGVFGNLNPTEDGRISGTGVAALRTLPDGREVVQGKFRFRAIGDQLMSRADRNYVLLSMSERVLEGEQVLEELQPALYEEILKYAHRLKEVFGNNQFFEFTIELNRVWITQTNDDLVKDGYPQFIDSAEYQPIGRGHGVSGGGLRGWAANTFEAAERLSARYNAERPKGVDGAILFLDRVNPEMVNRIPKGVHIMARVISVHAETLAQKYGITAVYGVPEMSFNQEEGVWYIGSHRMADGETISIDGHENQLVYHNSGKIFLGSVPLAGEAPKVSFPREAKPRPGQEPRWIAPVDDDLLDQERVKAARETELKREEEDAGTKRGLAARIRKRHAILMIRDILKRARFSAKELSLLTGLTIAVIYRYLEEPSLSKVKEKLLYRTDITKEMKERKERMGSGVVIDGTEPRAILKALAGLRKKGKVSKKDFIMVQVILKQIRTLRLVAQRDMKTGGELAAANLMDEAMQLLERLREITGIDLRALAGELARRRDHYTRIGEANIPHTRGEGRHRSPAKAGKVGKPVAKKAKTGEEPRRYRFGTDDNDRLVVDLEDSRPNFDAADEDGITPLSMSEKKVSDEYAILVNGYGVIGSKVAQAARSCGFNVAVSDVSEEAMAAALRDGFIVYPAAADALADLEKIDIVVDATPPGVGAQMKKIYGNRRVIYQGGEPSDITDISFTLPVADYGKVSAKKQIRVVTCNTSAMFNVFTPLLEKFNGLAIDLEIENVAEHKPESYIGKEHQATDRHKTIFLGLLPPGLKKRLSRIETNAATNSGLRHYHMHRAIVKAPLLTAAKVKEILAAESRVALIEPREGGYDAKDEAERIYNIVSPIAEHPMVVIAQVLPTGNANEAEIVYAVPHESNVVPENIDALHAMLAMHDKAESRRLVDEILGIDEIKKKIEEPSSETARLIASIHKLASSLGAATQPIPQGAKILLSQNLFDEVDGKHISGLLRGGNVEVVELRELKRRATNSNTTKDNLIIVLSKQDFEDKATWNGSDKGYAIRSSVLILKDSLMGANYLYLEGVVKLAGAIIRQDTHAVKSLYKILAGVPLEGAVLDTLKDNPIAFALKAMLKFKPITVADPEELERYKIMMEKYLKSA